MVLDDSQETFDVLCALTCRAARAAADIPMLDGMDVRMTKSRRHVWNGRAYLPIRLFFFFDEELGVVQLLVVEEEDELEEHVRDEHSTFTWLLEALIERSGFALEHAVLSDDRIFAKYVARAV